MKVSNKAPPSENTHETHSLISWLHNFIYIMASIFPGGNVTGVASWLDCRSHLPVSRKKLIFLIVEL